MLTKLSNNSGMNAAGWTPLYRHWRASALPPPGNAAAGLQEVGIIQLLQQLRRRTGGLCLPPRENELQTRRGNVGRQQRSRARRACKISGRIAIWSSRLTPVRLLLLVHGVRLRRSFWGRSFWGRLRTITCDRSLWFESHQSSEYVCVGLSFVAGIAEDLARRIIVISQWQRLGASPIQRFLVSRHILIIPASAYPLDFCVPYMTASHVPVELRRDPQYAWLNQRPSRISGRSKS